MVSHVCPSCGGADFTSIETIEAIQGFIVEDGSIAWTGDCDVVFDNASIKGIQCSECDWYIDVGPNDWIISYLVVEEQFEHEEDVADADF